MKLSLLLFMQQLEPMPIQAALSLENQSKQAFEICVDGQAQREHKVSFFVQ